jgi:hypothetical protein
MLSHATAQMGEADMGFLRRLVGGRGRQNATPGQEWPPPGPITTWPVGESFSSKFPAVLFLPKEGATVEVSKVLDCQDTLELIVGGRSLDGPRKPDHVAMLLPEPLGPYGADAVRVVVIPTKRGQPWGKVGYLSRDDAVRYRPVIDRVAAIEKVTVCRVSLNVELDRGLEDRPYIGVALQLDTPTNLMLELDKKLPA